MINKSFYKEIENILNSIDENSIYFYKNKVLIKRPKNDRQNCQTIGMREYIASKIINSNVIQSTLTLHKKYSFFPRKNEDRYYVLRNNCKKHTLNSNILGETQISNAIYNDYLEYKKLTNLGRPIYYETPIGDGSLNLGKIDLTTIKENVVLLHEAKRLDGDESILRAAFELETYYQSLISSNNLESMYHDFNANLNENLNIRKNEIRKVITVYKGTRWKYKNTLMTREIEKFSEMIYTQEILDAFNISLQVYDIDKDKLTLMYP